MAPPEPSPAMQSWADAIRGGDVRAISRALSAIEDGAPEPEALLRELFRSTGRAFRIGITGAPGSGKSTLVDGLAAHYRRNAVTTGILAVDPTSPFTGGAILGDRIRMQTHASDPGVFIRSLATRGHLGGLAQAAGDAALVLDAAGKQIILIETVGVGQGEVEVARLAHCTLLVLVPGMGDDVQSLKAGVMEIADIFVLNKSDRPEADRFDQQLRSILQFAPEREGWKPPVVRVVATENQGVDELAAEIERFRAHSGTRAQSAPSARELAYWKDWLLRRAHARLLERLGLASEEDPRLATLARDVASRAKDPFAAADELLPSP